MEYAFSEAGFEQGTVEDNGDWFNYMWRNGEDKVMLSIFREGSNYPKWSKTLPGLKDTKDEVRDALNEFYGVKPGSATVYPLFPTHAEGEQYQRDVRTVRYLIDDEGMDHGAARFIDAVKGGYTQPVMVADMLRSAVNRRRKELLNTYAY